MKSLRPCGTVHSATKLAQQHRRCSRVQCKVAQPAVEAREQNPVDVAGPSGTSDGARWGHLKARKMLAQPVVEQQRPLATYMALPASQYSVLDARKIERLSDDMFRCYVGQLKFGSFSVEPVLTVSVTVEQQGCTIRLLSCRLEGSDYVNDINNKFSASMDNIIRYRDGPTPEQKELTSDTTIEVKLQIPRWCSFIPTSTIENTGSSVLQATLNAAVPRFLQQLRKDYELWASGDDSRRPVE